MKQRTIIAAAVLLLCSATICNGQPSARFDIGVAEVWAKQQTTLNGISLAETYGVPDRLSFPEVKMCAMTPYLSIRASYSPPKTVSGQSIMTINSDDVPVTTELSMSSAKLDIGYPIISGRLVFEPQLVLMQYSTSIYTHGYDGKHTINQYQPLNVSAAGIGCHIIQNLPITNSMATFSVAISQQAKQYDIWLMQYINRYYGGIGYTHRSLRNDVIDTTISGGQLLIGVMF